jgi:hypothetical protein
MPKMTKIVVSLRSICFSSKVEILFMKTKIEFKFQKSEFDVLIIEG